MLYKVGTISGELEKLEDSLSKGDEKKYIFEYVFFISCKKGFLFSNDIIFPPRKLC
ncbi:MAG: Uncharacterised protein [Flavobacterium sp. SCGC AAA160-P02]|nr:MAG: Uncharacterised protein [Flavobacterium sp. SCGC AAA160-P02]